LIYASDNLAAIATKGRATSGALALLGKAYLYDKSMT
jgi:hypothetical protein